MSAVSADNHILAIGEAGVGAPLIAYFIGSGNLLGAASASLLMGASLLHFSVSPRVNSIGSMLTGAAIIGLTLSAPEIFAGPAFEIPRAAARILGGAAIITAIPGLMHHKNG